VPPAVAVGAAGSALPVLAVYYALARDRAAARAAAEPGGGGARRGAQPAAAGAGFGAAGAAAAPLARLTAAVRGDGGAYGAIQARRAPASGRLRARLRRGCCAETHGARRRPRWAEAVAAVAPGRLADAPAAPAGPSVAALAPELAAALTRSTAPGAAWQWLEARPDEAAALLSCASASPGPAVALLAALRLALGAPRALLPRPAAGAQRLTCLSAAPGALTVSAAEEAAASLVLAALAPALQGCPASVQAAFAAWWGRLPPALSRALAPGLARGLCGGRAPEAVDEPWGWDELALAPLALLACRPAVWASPALARRRHELNVVKREAQESPRSRGRPGARQAGLMAGLALDALAAGRIAAAALLGGAAGGSGPREAGPGGALRGGAAAALLGRDAAAAQLLLAACEVAGPEHEVSPSASAPPRSDRSGAGAAR